MSHSPRPEDIVYDGFIRGLKPDPITLKVSEWADKFRLLSSKASAEPGPWRTNRTPYLREILDKLSINDPCDTVVLMKAAQIGATEAGNNWLGYIVDLTPGPTMMVQPTVDMMKRLAKQRLDPMFIDTPRLKEKVTEKKSRDSKNTMFIKEFPGGMLLLAGANSPTGLRSAPMRNLFLDEVDGYPEDCGGEGSPIKLAEARTRTFKRNRKIFITSTPTIKNHSVIETNFELTDQRYYFVACPHCGFSQRLVFENLKWEKGLPETVKYFCVDCGAGIDEGHKNKMLAAGEWKATATSTSKKMVGYHLNALYSPLGWFSWADIAKEFEEAQGDVIKLKTFVNTILGETWYEKGEAPDWEKLYRLKSDYPRGKVPPGVLLLTAGVDIQKDRIELEIVGWGRRMESWSIDYIRLDGDPGQEEVWKKLDKVLDQVYISSSDENHTFQIAKIAVDSGDNTQHVYNWVRKRKDYRVMAIKGRSKGVLMVESPRFVDVKKGNQKIRRGVVYYPVAVNLAKEELYSWLQLEPPLEAGDPYPRGFCHFPDYDNEYFKQLTAEEKKRVVRGGVSTYNWEKVRERNEALDCRVYARAAAYVHGIDKYQEAHWIELEDALRNQHAEPEALGVRKKSDFWQYFIMATQADLDAIEKAINSGVTRVKYQDREITYASMDSLFKIRDKLRLELGLTTEVRPVRAQMVFDSGL